MTHYGFPVCEDVSLVHEVRGEQDHLSCFPLLENVPKMASAVRVNTCRWLVKEYKPRVPNQGDSYAELPFLASGQLGRLCVSLLLKICVL